MFRRKEDSLFDNTTDPNQSRETAESATVISSQPAAPAASQPSSGNNPYASTPSMPRPPGSTIASGFRAASGPLGSDLPRNRMPEAKPISAPQSLHTGADKGKPPTRRVLTVGNDILLKGEIATCDRLVIEGKVDATLNDVHTVEIAENGSFKGSANIEDAEISGLFEGDLVVRNRLVIYSTGKVRGKITYGEIEIERGGELSGEIKSQNGQPSTMQRAPQRKKEEAAAA